MSDLNDFQGQSRRTMDHSLTPNMALTNYSMGLVGESAECLDYLKKVIFHGHELDHDKLKEELGDVLFYLSALATVAGISLKDIAKMNINKLMKRYPDGFSKEKSINRVD